MYELGIENVINFDTTGWCKKRKTENTGLKLNDTIALQFL